MIEDQGKSEIPVFVDESNPKIADHANGARIGDWHPSNKAAIKLIRCLEAIRDLAPLFDFLSEFPRPGESKRFVKAISVPLYSLATGVRDVFGEIENSKRGEMSKEKRQLLLKRMSCYVEKIFSDNKGALKTVRDKMGAHIDEEAILGGHHMWKNVDLVSFVKIIGICLLELDGLMHFDAYAWSRGTDRPELVRYMNVDGKLVDIVTEDGKTQIISAVTLVKSPLDGIAEEVNRFVAVVNKISYTSVPLNT